MQNPDGHMTELSAQQFGELLTHGSAKIARVGDVFRVRRCYFRIETISDYGISARGISRREFIQGKAALPLAARLGELPEER